MVEGSGNAADAYYVVTPTESEICRAVRHWLLEILPDGMQVVQGQQNRNAAPRDPFAVMVMIDRERLATNGWTYDGETTRILTEQVQVTMQVNLFGPASSNQMQLVTALWRDMQAVDFFRASGVPITPLATSSTRQLGFETGERQYDDLWTVDLTMQVTLTTRLPQDFATSIPVVLTEVQTTYPE